MTGRYLPTFQQDFFGGSWPLPVPSIMSHDLYARQLGIPFAEAPVGERRLEPPVLKLELGVRGFDASEFGFACIQPVSIAPTTSGVANSFTYYLEGDANPRIEHFGRLPDYQYSTAVRCHLSIQTTRGKLIQFRFSSFVDEILRWSYSGRSLIR